MPLDIETLCKYRLERAEEDSLIQLKNAKIFLEIVKDYIQKREFSAGIINQNVEKFQ